MSSISCNPAKQGKYANMSPSEFDEFLKLMVSRITKYNVLCLSYAELDDDFNPSVDFNWDAKLLNLDDKSEFDENIFVSRRHKTKRSFRNIKKTREKGHTLLIVQQVKIYARALLIPLIERALQQIPFYHYRGKKQSCYSIVGIESQFFFDCNVSCYKYSLDLSSRKEVESFLASPFPKIPKIILTATYTKKPKENRHSYLQLFNLQRKYPYEFIFHMDYEVLFTLEKCILLGLTPEERLTPSSDENKEWNSFLTQGLYDPRLLCLIASFESGYGGWYRYIGHTKW